MNPCGRVAFGKVSSLEKLVAVSVPVNRFSRRSLFSRYSCLRLVGFTSMVLFFGASGIKEMVSVILGLSQQTGSVLI